AVGVEAGAEQVLGGVEAGQQPLPAAHELVGGQRLGLAAEQLGVVGADLVGEAAVDSGPVEVVDGVEQAGEHGGGVIGYEPSGIVAPRAGRSSTGSAPPRRPSRRA